MNLIMSTDAKLLIIGTSHTAMFRDAWLEMPPDEKRGIAADFIAMPAAFLAKQVSDNLDIRDGIWYINNSHLVNYLGRVGQLGDGFVDFSKYRAILFVDMFFCYDYAHLMSRRINGSLRLDGVPASWALWERAVAATLGVVSYRQHAQVGAVPRTSMSEVMRTAVCAIAPGRVFLTPRPMVPTQRLVHRAGDSHNREDILEYARRFEELSSSNARSLGVEFVSRPTESICETTGATRNEYSVGLLAGESELLDEHLTSEYAMPILRYVVSCASV